MKFAKLFDLDTHQVLVTISEEENDVTKEITYELTEEVRHNGTAMSLKHGYKTKKIRDKDFENYSEIYANRLLNKALSLIE